MRDYDEVCEIMQTYYVDTGLMTKEEMYECLENTNKISSMVDIRLNFDTFHVPRCVDFGLDKLSDEEYYHKSREIFKKLSWEGMEVRFKNGMADVNKKEEYLKQLQFEYDVLSEKNFIDYFLIVRDICVDVRCKVPLGLNVGRGSVGGSLIAYCLGITEVDPLKFGLVFERFLNPRKGGKRRNLSLL